MIRLGRVCTQCIRACNNKYPNLVNLSGFLMVIATTMASASVFNVPVCTLSIQSIRHAQGKCNIHGLIRPS